MLSLDNRVKINAVFVVYGTDVPKSIKNVDPDKCTEKEWIPLRKFLFDQIIDNGIVDTFDEELLAVYGKPGDYEVDIGFELLGEVDEIVD